jgi:hypothetical protein
MQATRRKQTMKWGDSTLDFEVVGYERKPLTHHAWKREQISCIPTIRKLAYEGFISLLTYSELQHERLKRPGSFPPSRIGNIFSGITINHVNAAVERSYFFQQEIGTYIKVEEVIGYCKWLLTPGIERLAEKLSGNSQYPSHLLENLGKIQRFRDLCSGLSEKQYPDAFHLWTAEVNHSDYFLTIDGKFIRAMTETKKIHLPCKPISPLDLLSLFEVDEREPFEYQEDQFYDIGGRPFRGCS